VGDLKIRLIEAGKQAGLDRVGFTTAGPFPAAGRDLHRRKSAGLAGGLGFTFSNPDIASNPQASFPWAVSLVVGAKTYLPGSGSPGTHDPGTGRISRAASADHYGPLREGLNHLATLLAGEGYRAEVVCDDNRLVDRAAAIRAGIGWWGKNTMVLAPGFGPWLLLGSVVTDLFLETDSPETRDCGTCSACLPACPTGALVAPGVLDARLCLAAWTQTPGLVPIEIRRAMGDRIYGCDDCIEACPPGSRILSRAVHRGGRVELTFILNASDSVLLDRFGHWFIPDRDPRIIRRNALIAAGNSGHQPLVPLIASYAGYPDWVLRAHAIWSLQQLGGPLAEAVLADRERHETDPRVRAEIWDR
jgi:epoxyqueuosine reductase